MDQQNKLELVLTNLGSDLSSEFNYSEFNYSELSNKEQKQAEKALILKQIGMLRMRFEEMGVYVTDVLVIDWNFNVEQVCGSCAWCSSIKTPNLPEKPKFQKREHDQM